MPNIRYERIDNREKIDEVFRMMMTWEREYFPSGSWIPAAFVKEFREAWHKNKFFVRLAWSGSTVAGFSSWWHSTRKVSWLNNLWVDPLFRGRGIAQLLVRFAVDDIWDEGRKPRVMVIEDNAPMLHVVRNLHYFFRGNEQFVYPKFDYWGDGRKLRYIRITTSRR